ncbi:hypothetical protein QTI33_34310 [Variovorax sp. J22P271]|uniref:hypothetical protein n=1 Tax=Variovorax davisae TaxID=3053515 RepID=UPI0025755203|nr:hypothetical protein [Variovorax sp. J22P271]MDM0037243.1 hypothetical protein [Variovorax sp. J22P271]
MSRKIIQEILKQWPPAEQLNLKGEHKTRFNRIQSALKVYATGGTVEAAAKRAKLSRVRFHTLIKRAITLRDGKYFGHRVAKKHERLETENKVRTLFAPGAGGGKPGSFSRLIQSHPRLRRILEDLVLHQTYSTGEKVETPIPAVLIYSEFDAAVAREQIHPNDLPSRKTLNRYVAKLREKKEHQEQATRDGWIETRSDLVKDIAEVYAQVECDGYSIDIDYYIEIPGRIPNSFTRIRAKRIWLIAIVERVTQTVLGYSIALGANYSASDVLRAVRHALVPNQRRSLTLLGLEYEPGETFPAALPGLAYVCFDEFHVDNAKANLANLTLSTLENGVNAAPIFGPISSPNYRASVEGLFGILQKAAFNHWKSKPVLSLNHIEDAVDVLLAAHNNAKATGYNCTRLELLVELAGARGCELRRVPQGLHGTVFKYDLFETVTISQDGKSPVVRWQNARYYGGCLNRIPSIVGKEAMAMGSADDPRTLELILLATGEILGAVRIESRWSHAPHHLATRGWTFVDEDIKTLTSRASDITRALLLHASEPSKSAPQARKKAVIARDIARSASEADSNELRAETYQRLHSLPSVPSLAVDDFLKDIGTL